MDYGDDQMAAWLRGQPEAHPKPMPEAQAWHQERIRRAAAGHRMSADELAAQGIQDVPPPAVAQGDAAQAAQAPPPPEEGADFGAIARGSLGYEGALGQAQLMDASRRTVRRDNPMYEPTREYVETSREVNDRRGGLAENVYKAEMAEAAAAADGADLMAETKMDIADREMARAARDQQRHVAVEENLLRYQSKIDDAVQRLQETQKVDPSAGWENKSGWQKVRFVLASMFRGLSGRDPLDLAKFEVENEVAAQKANQGRALAEVDAAMSEYRTAGLGMRDSMLAISQDERAADSMTRVALYEGIAAKMEATALEQGIDVNSEMYQEKANELQQTIAAEKLKLSQIEASNPRYFTRTASTMGAEERRTRRKMGDEMVDSGGEAFKQGVAAERDQIKHRGDRALQKEKDNFTQRKHLAQETSSMRQELELIDKFRKKYKDDIPGVSAVSRVTPDIITRQFEDNRAARAELKRIVKVRLRRESGAAISEEEVNDEASRLVGAMSEGDVWQELDQRYQEAKSNIDLRSRAVSKDAESEYLARPVGERGALRRQGAGGGLDSLTMDE